MCPTHPHLIHWNGFYKINHDRLWLSSLKHNDSLNHTYSVGHTFKRTVQHRLGIIHGVMDLTNMFFLISSRKENQKQLPFTWKGEHCTFICLHNGYVNFLALTYSNVQRDPDFLDSWRTSPGSSILITRIT